MGRGRVFLRLLIVACSGCLALLVFYQIGDKTNTKTKFAPGFDIQLTDKAWHIEAEKESYTKSFLIANPILPEDIRHITTPYQPSQHRLNYAQTKKNSRATDAKHYSKEDKESNIFHGSKSQKIYGDRVDNGKDQTPLIQNEQSKPKDTGHLNVSKKVPHKGQQLKSAHARTTNKTDTVSRDKTHHTVKADRKIKKSEVITTDFELEDPKPQLNIEKEALDEWRKALEQQQYNLQHWKLEEEKKLTAERDKLEAERKRILQEKRQLKKDISEAANGMLESNQYPPPGFQKLQIPENLAPANPKYWNGLNSTLVHSKFHGIAFLPDFSFHEFVDGSDSTAPGMQGHPKSIDDISDSQAEERFYQLISQRQMECAEVQRMGSIGDGGWDVCVSEPYKPLPGCLVYSFGINYDFTFDDAMANTFGCEVRTFDPSMSIGDHMHSEKVFFYQIGLGSSNSVNEDGWKLNTLKSILKKLKHTDTVIDILKVDIEFNEWDSFGPMLKDGSLRNVRQLVFEMHTPEVFTVRRPATKGDFNQMYGVLRGLEELNFRRYRFHFNPMGIQVNDIPTAGPGDLPVILEWPVSVKKLWKLATSLANLASVYPIESLTHS